MRVFRLPFLALLLAGAASAAEVTIYRCTDDRGRLTLRDSPCLKGERQQARSMVRPQDPPARSAPAVTTSPRSPAAAPVTRTVLVRPPRPLYECVTPDGSSYISQTGSGDLRQVPLWTLGYPAYGHHDRGTGHRGRDGFPVVARPRTLDGRVPSGLVFDNVGRPTPKPSGDRPGVPSRPRPPVIGHGFYYPTTTWVRDECHPLPQQQVCARLRDRRHELDRRYNSALQGERDRITHEQRDIDARLSEDCGPR